MDCSPKKQVLGYEEFYDISENGNLFSKHKSLFGKNASKGYEFPLSAHTDNNGYVSVALVKNRQRKTHKLHRLVAQAFIPNPENKPCVNHKNGIKTDNRAENLEWVTYSENERHSIKQLGKKKPKGQDSPLAKLNDEAVIKIKMQLQKGEKSSNIARMFNVSPQQICCIKKAGNGLI